jgi:ATP-dependent DNA helicase DinG
MPERLTSLVGRVFGEAPDVAGRQRSMREAPVAGGRPEAEVADPGPLARAVPEFEPRPGQRDMARAGAATFEQGGRMLVEAGTGTGKTLAYLVPAILSRQRVLISTGTKNLQEQIYFKDLPDLAGALDVHFTAAYMKGRGNYLCRQRLETLCESHGAEPPFTVGPARDVTSDPGLRTPDFGSRTSDCGRRVDPMFAMLVDWARETETGDRAELSDLPEDLPLWNEVAATSEFCIGANCPHYGDCYVTRMRQRAAEADIVIVNHHLLCADAAVRQNEYGEVIPACAYAVVDEAHQLEDVATQYFGIAVSNYRVEDLCHDAEQVVAARLARDVAGLGPGPSIEHLRDAARTFFVGLQFARMAGAPGSSNQFGRATRPADEGQAARAGRTAAGTTASAGEDRMRVDSEALADTVEAGHDLAGALDGVEQAFYAVKDPPEDVLAIARRAGEIRDQLRFLLRAGDPDFVYYLETRGRGVFLRASPIDVSRIVRDQLLDRFQAVVLTSATLSVGGSFDYVRGRLGAQPATELRLPSEFDYSQQALLYLPARMPDPRSHAFADAAAEQIVEILARTRGRAFVLFTSYAVLRAVQPVVERALSFPVLVQGSAPRTLLLQQFRTTPHAVLLATSSFWQGVDVVGEALSCVIVDKLPFASPADPVTSARMEAISRGGGEPFWEYQVPLAILALQQGLGRLIRHRRDRGVLAVLDPRLLTKAYGQAFLQALPPAPRTSNLDDIRRFFGD